MTNTAALTEKQENYILSLATKVAGRPVRYLSQLKDIGIPVSCWKGMTKAQASLIIDDLKARVAA